MSYYSYSYSDEYESQAPKDKSNSESLQTCIICMLTEDEFNQEYGKNEKLISLNKECQCVYKLHRECFAKWNDSNRGVDCFMCRKEIIPKRALSERVNDEDVAVIIDALSRSGLTDAEIDEILAPIQAPEVPVRVRVRDEENQQVPDRNRRKKAIILGTITFIVLLAIFVAAILYSLFKS